MKSQKVPLVVRKKYRKKNNCAVAGKVSLKTSPSMRAEIDAIARKNRVSINHLCCCGLRFFLTHYRLVGDLDMFQDAANPPRAGRKRVIHHVEE